MMYEGPKRQPDAVGSQQPAATFWTNVAKIARTSQPRQARGRCTWLVSVLRVKFGSLARVIGF